MTARMNAFETLGIAPCLVMDGQVLRDAFREAGKRAHPDAGGGDQEFAALRQAFEILSSPSRRLRHWLELRGMPVELRGSVASGLMDLFARIGETSQQAAALGRRREEAKSALGRAMIEGETQACREAVEQAIALVEAAIERECALFPQLESAVTPDPAIASAAVRNLAFLEKWRSGLRASFARLV